MYLLLNKSLLTLELIIKNRWKHNHSIDLGEKQIGTELLKIRSQIYMKFKTRKRVIRIVVTLREIVYGRRTGASRMF